MLTESTNGFVHSVFADCVIDEIIGIDNDKIFIIDDDFLVNKERVEYICNRLLELGIHKTFMIFSRADSIVRCEDIMPLVYKAGIRDMLVGLEAVDDSTLEKYNKNSSVSLNKNAVRILRDNNMLCVGLFVINYDFSHKDFMHILKKRNSYGCCSAFSYHLKGQPYMRKTRTGSINTDTAEREVRAYS